MAITNPRDISGLVVWYSAEAETGYTNDQTMTQWTDRSGNGNHATPIGTNKPQWQTSTGPGAAGPAVHFIGVGNGSGSGTTGHFALPTSLMTGSAGEIFYQLRVDSTKPSSGAGQLHGFNNPDYSYYPFADGKIYDAFGTTVRKDAITPTLAVNSWRRLNIWSAGSDYALSLDGTSQFTTTTNTVAWYANPVIGSSANIGGVPTTGTTVQPFKGWMTTVVLFNRKLTTGERADLHAWMAANPNGGDPKFVPPVTRSTTWKIQKSIAPTRDATWDTRKIIAQTRAVSWNVTLSPPSVTITRTTTWKAKGRITVTKPVSWNVLSSLTFPLGPFTLDYGVTVAYTLHAEGLVLQPGMRVTTPRVRINVGYQFSRNTPTIPSYRAIVTDTSGKQFAELNDAALDPVQWSVADMTTFGFTMPADSPNADWMQEVRYEVQVWRNADLMWWGPIYRVQNEGRTIRVQCNDVSWYFAARVMGPVPKVNLLESAKPGEPAGYGGWKPKALPRSGKTTGPSMASSPNTYNDRPALKLSSSEGKESITYDNDEWYDGEKFNGKGKNQLRVLMDELVDFSVRAKIQVKVFDDNILLRDANIERARARAESVSDWVLDQYPNARVSQSAPGYRYALNDNSTSAERKENRRTKVIYRSVDGVKGHKQCAYQTVEVRNPQPHHRKEAVTFSAYVFIEEEAGWAAGMRGLEIIRTEVNPIKYPHCDWKWKAQGYAKVLQDDIVPFGDGFPTEVWVRVECQVVLPNNGKKSKIEVRMFPPNGDACFSEMWLTRDSGLYYRNVEQADIIEALVKHAQDPEMGKSDLNISTNINKTGKRRTREYPFSDRATISDHLEEFPKLADGMEWQIIYTPDDRIFTTYYPRLGKDTDVVLASGSNIAAYDVSSDGSALSTTVIIQAPTGDGASREERTVSDPTLMDGLVLEKAYTGTPNSPASSWRAQAERGLARYRRPVVIPQVTMDPQYTEELLQSVHIGDRVTTDISDEVRNIDVFEKCRVTAISLDPRTDSLTYTLTAEDIKVVNLSPFGTPVRYFSQAQNPIVGVSGEVPVESNIGYSARTFNDSAWATGTPGIGWVKEAAFGGLQVNPEHTPHTLVADNHEVWIRKHVMCTGDMVLTVRAADWAYVYVNGHLVTGDYFDGYNKHGKLFRGNLRIKSTWLDPSGDQVVAVHVQFKPFIRSSVEMDSLYADVAVRGTYDPGVVV